MTQETLRERAFRRWFGASRAVELACGSTSRDAVFAPQVMYHTTRSGAFERFEIGRPTINTTTFADVETRRHAIFVTPSITDSNAYGVVDGTFVEGAATMPLYIKAENPLDLTDGPSEADTERLVVAGFSERFVYNHLHRWDVFDDAAGAENVRMIQLAGFDAVVYWDENPLTGDAFEAWALFQPEQLVSALQFPEARSLRLPAIPENPMRKIELMEISL
jgi:hypothetical protein